MKTTTERIKNMPQIKRAIIAKLFTFLDSKRNSDQWWKYKGQFSYDGQEYTIECQVKMDNKFLTYKDLHIEHKQVIIDVDDMVQKGLLN